MVIFTEKLEKRYLDLLEKQKALNERLLNTSDEAELLKNLDEYTKISEECDEVSKQLDVSECVESLKERGAVVIQHKSILFHKNGAKLPVAKNYIEDGILKKDKNYTVIFLPEKG